MWRGDVPTQRNPMELVTIRGATKRKRNPRSLTVEEFRLFAQNLVEPFRTIALLCVCLGLRISECLALRWSDVDWLNGKLRVERGIVCQQVDEVKTAESRHMPIDACLLNVLKAWKQTTEFPNSEDWMFASPVQLGAFRGHTTSYGVCTTKQRRRLKSADLARTVFDIISFLAGFGRHPGGRTTKAHAARRYQNDHERVWRCSNGRDDGSAQQSSWIGSKRSASRAQGELNHSKFGERGRNRIHKET